MHKLLLNFLLCIILISMTACSGNEKETTIQSSNDVVSEEEETTKPELTFNNNTALELMEKFQFAVTSLFEDTDEHLKLNSYQLKAEVTEYFEDVMSDELAASMADAFFYEEDGGLYVVPRDSPAWFDEEQPFQIEKVSDTHYKIIQEQNDELNGHVKMVYQAKYEEGIWRVSDLGAEEINTPSDETADDQSAESTTVIEMADTIIHLIEEKDFAALSDYVKPEKGVLLSPYVHVEKDAVVLQREDLHGFFETETTYTWGNFDGSGEPIKLTPSKYYDQFIYDNAYTAADEILVDEFVQRGNTINTIKDRFPNSSTVEFYKDGTSDYAGMDWSSLNLVFEKTQSNTWVLVAIIHDSWTI